MRNPWLALPREPPFVLPKDAAAIEAFNQTATANTRFSLDLIPEPFLGNPNALIVLLSLNPSVTIAGPGIHADVTFARSARANLAHQTSDYPFYLLNPAVPERSPGRQWWEGRLRPLIEATARETVASNILCVEYFGYHSKRFARRRHPRLPSQDYSFFLVRQALARLATVVLMRSHNLWLSAVPELQSYPNLIPLGNVRNTVISPHNCPQGGFDHIVAQLLNDRAA
jgi:hypothetical protein